MGCKGISSVILQCNIPKFYNGQITYIMKNYSLTAIVLLVLLSSFTVDKACDYAGSNINYVKSQTEKALAVDDINQARFYTYKAVNSIEKSKKQLKDCGCTYAEESISDGLSDLILATKATSLNGTRILLNRALEHIIGGIESIEEHELHNSKYGSNLLAMNTIVSDAEKMAMQKPSGKEFEVKIDASLEKYRESLDKIVNSVDCASARAFAENIYFHCEQQLLLPNLTEGKKYYNYRTKEITAEALEKLQDCK
jgi:soluble cytochrome b562